MKKGFTLIETLIACLMIPLVMTFVLGMLVLMNNFEDQSLTQHEVFQVQMRQMLSRARILDCEGLFVFSKNSNEFELAIHDRRLVKSPGFEILLYDVEDFSFFPEGDSCMLYYSYKGKEVELEIPYQY